MLSVRLDIELERLLERDVDDLARYNILRYLHDRPSVRGGVSLFSDELGLRSAERTEEALEALCRAGFLTRSQTVGTAEAQYSLTTDDTKRALVDRLYRLSSAPYYGEVVEALAAKSLRRARKAQMAEARKSAHQAA